jgi:mitochondrial import inner membrane translocase subunit TIM44
MCVSHLLSAVSRRLNTRQLSFGKILENNVPVFMVTFATQEMLLFRNAKTGEVVVGAEDRVEQCHYGAVMHRSEEQLQNELTGGWKVIEVSQTLSLLHSKQDV